MTIEPTRFQLELLAISLYQMDKGTMRQWSGIELAERVRYRTLATDLLMEDSYAATEAPKEVVVEPFIINMVPVKPLRKPRVTVSRDSAMD